MQKIACYSIQPRYWIFVKSYGFLFFAKNMSKDIVENIVKNLSGKYIQKLLDHANNLLEMDLELFEKEQFKKQMKQMAIWLILKSFHHRIIWRQLKVKQKIQDCIEKYQKKDIYTYISSENRQQVVSDLRLM